MAEQEKPTSAQQRLQSWRSSVEQARYRKPFMPKARKTPASVPPTARRLMLLLDWINTPDGQVLAIKRQPPLTGDMRMLISKSYCRLERRFPMQYSQELAASLRRSTAQRVTRIVITDAGRKALEKAHVPDEDYEYLRAALQTMTLL